MTVEDVRKDIPLTSKYIYADNGATTPVPIPVVDAIKGYFVDYCSNVERGAYAIAARASEEWDQAREDVAHLLMKCKTDEMIFTRNLTECSGIVAHSLQEPILDMDANGNFGAGDPLVDWKPGDRILISDMEHHSNIMPWIRLAHRVSAKVEAVESSEIGLLTPEAFAEKMDKNVRFAAFQHVSNALGTIHPVKDIIKVMKEVNPDLLVYVDGSQGPGHMPVDVRDINADFYGFSGHKGCLGPQGSGGLFIKEEVMSKTDPLLLGGGTMMDVTYSNYKLRTDSISKRFAAGTPSIAIDIGLGRAAVYSAKQIGLERIEEREKMLSNLLVEQLDGVEGLEVYGPRADEHRGGVVTFNVEGWNSMDVALLLEEEHNILTRSGTHCCIPLMRKMGVHDKYGGNVRASFHFFNTEEEVKTIADALKEMV